MLFVNQHAAKSTEQLLASAEWEAMVRFLVDFKDLCEQNEITPVIVYIPTASEVYAEYSTLDSGANWLAVRKSEIETSGNNEKAARILARKVGVQMISLLPSFQHAAREGSSSIISSMRTGTAPAEKSRRKLPHEHWNC